MKKLAITFALVLATVTACSSSSDNTGSSSGTSGTSGAPASDSGAPAGNTVMVTSNKFVPASLTIKVGDTVTWTWAGGAHSVTSGANCVDDKAYGAPVTSTNGFTFTHTYDKAGSFEYFCIPHCMSSGMKGTIVVQ